MEMTPAAAPGAATDSEAAASADGSSYISGIPDNVPLLFSVNGPNLCDERVKSPNLFYIDCFETPSSALG